jgi:hypothetical protein
LDIGSWTFDLRVEFDREFRRPIRAATFMTAEKCQYSGCGGTIDQGFCDRCGLAPVGSSVAAATASAAISRVTTGTASSGTAGSSFTGSLSGRTGISSSSRRGTGTSRSSTRRHLGLGLVNVPGLPEINPEQIIMSDPKVPDHKRFCSNPDCHDSDGQPTALNRRLTGHCPNCGRFYSFLPTLKTRGCRRRAIRSEGLPRLRRAWLDLPGQGQHAESLGGAEGFAQQRR